jgi:hypothetical protein
VPYEAPLSFTGSSESSSAVVITPADRPVRALVKVRTRRPAYRFAAAIPRSPEASTDFWAAWLIQPQSLEVVVLACSGPL